MLLLIDIGGTKTRLAIVHQEEILRETIVPTPKNFNDATNQMQRVIDEIRKDVALTAAVCGAPGVLTPDKSALLNAPNLPEWNGKPLKLVLKELTGVDVYLENDSALAGLGEAVYGAGKGYTIVAYLTISTGIGGARIVNKKIDTSYTGFEPGHQYIDFDRSSYPNSLYGTLEYTVTGHALKQMYGIEPEEIEDDTVWEEVEQVIAFGINNTIVHWSPEVVVLGGGLINNGVLSVDRIADHLDDVLYIFPEAPVLKASELKDQSGLYGGMAFLMEKI